MLSRRRRDDSAAKTKEKFCISSYYADKDYARIKEAIKVSGAPNRAAFVEMAVFEKVESLLKK